MISSAPTPVYGHLHTLDGQWWMGSAAHAVSTFLRDFYLSVSILCSFIVQLDCISEANVIP